MGRDKACMGEIRHSCKILVGKCERKILFWRHRRRLENQIKIDLKEIGWEVIQNRYR